MRERNAREEDVPVGPRLLTELARASSVPAVVGRYQITDRIATGTTSEMFKGVLFGEHGFKKPVAIKRLIPKLAGDPTAVELFLDEARIAARLSHRNIIEVLELGSDGETQFLAMQHVDGLDLSGLSAECSRTRMRIPPELAGLIVREILEALDYAHHAIDPAGQPLEILHRDLSPGNVMVSWTGDVKLVDFGRAVVAGSRHEGGGQSLRGKCGHMSPEQVGGSRVDARSDVFQAGILLAELVMGKKLFGAERELDILMMVRECDLSILDVHAKEFPVELLAVTMRALERDPADRWQSAAEFRDAIDDAIERKRRVTRRDLAALLSRLSIEPTATTPGRPFRASALGSGAIPPLANLRDDQEGDTVLSGAPIAMADDSQTSRMDVADVLAALHVEANRPNVLERATTGTDVFHSRTFEHRLEQTLRIANGSAHGEPEILSAGSAAAAAQEPESIVVPSLRPSRLPLFAVTSMLAAVAGGLVYLLS
ncbi:MAG: serine/threonine-protein kinase [Kofleriaceae bacterium]